MARERQKKAAAAARQNRAAEARRIMQKDSRKQKVWARVRVKGAGLRVECALWGFVGRPPSPPPKKAEGSARRRPLVSAPFQPREHGHCILIRNSATPAAAQANPKALDCGETLIAASARTCLCLCGLLGRFASSACVRSAAGGGGLVQGLGI